MRKHVEMLVPGYDYYVSSNGKFLRIKGKITILPWEGRARKEI